MTYSRGVPAGDYTVNVHLYRDLQKEGAIPVAVVVSVKQAPDLPAKQIVARKLELVHEGQELTVMRFSLDAERPPGQGQRARPAQGAPGQEDMTGDPHDG